MSRTALYRHFDAAGQLLYVGISLSPVHRLGQHRVAADWYGDIARISIEWLRDRDAAIAAEANAIHYENPKHNKARPRIVSIRPPKRSLELGAFGIRHASSGRIDGWYRGRSLAGHMLGWWRAVFPGDAFDLVEPTPSMSAIGRDCIKLNWLNCEQWAVGPRVLASGDKYDREAA
jgi:hypothetical protein